MFFNVPVRVMIGINLVVFCLWNFFPDLLRFMAANFLVSWYHLEHGRYWVTVTSVFSHNALFHLALNMMVLLSFGGVMQRAMGRRRFLSFYLCAGIISSVAHSAISNFIMDAPKQMALGASGALAGLVLVFSLVFPKQKLLIFGVIPVPAIWGAIAFIALDLWGLTAQVGGGGLPIGHGAHLGGAFAGICYYLIWGRKLKKEFRASVFGR